MTTLTKTQTDLLRGLLPQPGPAPSHAHRTVTALIKRGFISETDGGAHHYAITEAGRDALSSEGAGPPEGGPPSGAAITQPKGKIATLVELLSQSDGTSIGQMMDATGWQAHSVRGALSGAIKKGLGLPVVSEKTDAGRRYRISAPAQ